MRIVSCTVNKTEKVGFLLGDQIYLCERIAAGLPKTMKELLEGGQEMLDKLKKVEQQVVAGAFKPVETISLRSASLLAPVPYPSSLRDAYAFREHVSTSRRNRGLEMIPEFDEFPVFYFSNHQAVVGPGPVSCMPRHLEKLDYELEVAVVLHKRGKNIPAAEADHYIAGYMIMNDLSARVMQMEEMKLSLGPAKGKDFATALGPWLVTKEELAAYKVETPEGKVGDVYGLKMSCSVNGKKLSTGNLADMHWTFAEIIERVSYGAEVFPGDVIGSGTVGTGCLLELNSTGKFNNPDYEEQWLAAGDKIRMEVTGLGGLTNRITTS